ncbi:cytochrome c biogenesis protein CcsA [Helicobacter sp. MIT 21-1697]|uniref:cytochrome c biogenesis protein CcsA n=1 Tax=Helicobacter sp. MIT 21-1697 TaxID=2993733 RepID=UPI00224AEA3C|nr:cytochrome c biogenesis protein CcsA [Helicobacter sp. MIT 21-1697]MCX2717759.1 cytochrome c biogenesis protein CcsA [Helicobacter sp. MIT 21-1697]
MAQIIKTLFCSMKMVLLLIGIYATACAIATFIEKFDGTLAARLWVYDAFWFEILHLWLALCLIGCFITSKAWQRKKYASLLLHSSFIVIIIGAGITRYYGFEGLMNLREGQSVNFISTNTHYIFIQIKSPQGDTQYVRIPTYIDKNINHTILQHLTFFDKPFTLKTGELLESQMSNVLVLDVNIDFLGKNTQTKVVREGNEAPTKESITMLDIEGYKVFLAWGVDNIALPFSIKLKKFELERYPGSNSPASYASEVELIDEPNPPMPFRIFMNNVLDYGGYRFFQSSYHPDEKGSILSVNNDPGKIPTYIGYAMLILGVIWLLFDKNGRFATLGRFLKTQKFLSLLLCAGLSLALLSPQSTYATSMQEDFALSPEDKSLPLPQHIPSMIKALQNSTSLTNDFDRILVQDFGGRIKPMHTLANEYIHKLTQKRTFQGLTPSQVFLGMLFYPQEWQSIKMIATKSPKLREILGLDKDEKYIAYIDVFTPQRQYVLQNYVEAANLKNPSSRDAFEKDVISVDERINYAFLIYTGQVLRIFPDKKANNNQWLYPLEAISSAVAQSDMQKARELMSIYKTFAQGMQQGVDTNNWQQAIQAAQDIRSFQQKNGASLLISPAKVDSEIWLNVYNPFYQLTYPYILISIVLFIIVLVGILKNIPTRPFIHKVFYILLLGLFILHTCALGLRWYVSEHAPWSNAYESMLYIAWAAILSGVVFFRRSNLALCASSFLAGITLFVAHLGDMDPQIGNLVPVLKSYWLNIHVSVITASYGFLGLCFMLGLITLIMFVLRSEKRVQVEHSILALSALNEMSMILGLFLLSVGNFLGGIWANESWGRYWGWDSKETWALISIGVYAIILHLRFIVGKNFPFIFASASVIGFFSVLMTYFGVNYYLTGMHSYAAGEAAPMPLWVKIMIAGIILLIFIASRKRVLDMPRL